MNIAPVQSLAAGGKNCTQRLSLTDEESRNVYLTDDGADKAEELFGIDMYSEEGVPLIAAIIALRFSSRS